MAGNYLLMRRGGRYGRERDAHLSLSLSLSVAARRNFQNDTHTQSEKEAKLNCRSDSQVCSVESCKAFEVEKSARRGSRKVPPGPQDMAEVAAAPHFSAKLSRSWNAHETRISIINFTRKISRLFWGPNGCTTLKQKIADAMSTQKQKKIVAICWLKNATSSKLINIVEHNLKKSSSPLRKCFSNKKSLNHRKETKAGFHTHLGRVS